MLALSRRSPLAERPVGPVGIVFLLIGAFVMLAPFYFMFVFATQPRASMIMNVGIMPKKAGIIMVAMTRAKSCFLNLNS